MAVNQTKLREKIEKKIFTTGAMWLVKLWQENKDKADIKFQLPPQAIDELLSLFKSHWLETIGRDKKLTREIKYGNDNDYGEFMGYNQAKAELRKKIKEEK